MSCPPIYVINLKRTPERRLYMQRQLDALNLNYQFIEAVDKYDLVSKTYRTALARQLDIDESQMEFLYRAFLKKRSLLKKTRLSFRGLGALGCLLSHVKVYNLMIDNNVPKACVLEDDAYLLPVFPKILVAAQKVPWDILMLFYHSTWLKDIIFPMFVGARAGKDLKLNLSNLCRYFYKLLCYKRYFPHLNPYIIRRIISIIAKYLSWTVSIKPFHLEVKIRRTCGGEIMRKIAGIPVSDRSTWYRVISNYYIARPYRGHKRPRLLSTTAYMLTKSAAIKWRNKAVVGQSKEIEADSIINTLDLNLYISVPPCVENTDVYTRGRKGSTI